MVIPYHYVTEGKNLQEGGKAYNIINKVNFKHTFGLNTMLYHLESLASYYCRHNYPELHPR